MDSVSWKVHKFGGTSVAGVDRYLNVAKLIFEDAIRSRTELGSRARTAVVVSAMSKVTDSLIELCTLAATGDVSWQSKAQALKDRHTQVVRELFREGSGEGAQETVDDKRLQESLLSRLEADFVGLSDVLKAVQVTRYCPDRLQEFISGHGELWSAEILRSVLHKMSRIQPGFVVKPGSSLEDCIQSIDARKILIVEPKSMTVAVDWKSSRSNMKNWLDANRECDLVVVTGFVASTPEGVATTLKRNGSDYSASLFGALLEAREIVIWTDVDGVLSADPRLVPDAVVVRSLSYGEASELAFFGAKVVHPSTMAPAIESKIPIWIKNTFRPDQMGTVIGDASWIADHGHGKSKKSLAKGFTVVEKVSLLTLQGTGMAGVPGTAERLFRALREADISVIVISQSSSEQSISLVVNSSVESLAVKAIEREFFSEIQQSAIDLVATVSHCSVIAAVGDDLAHHPGTAARFFGALAKASVNVRAIAQGANERNISAVIDGAESIRALRSVHAAFLLSDQVLAVAVLGNGGIGKTLIAQLEAQRSWLKENRGVDLRIRAVANSQTQWVFSDDPDTQRDTQKGTRVSVEEKLSQQPGEPRDYTKLVEALKPDETPHVAIIDCTADDEPANHYQTWLNKGVHVLTPNKKAGSGSLERYEQIRKAAKLKRRFFLYETTVGAGLPLLGTLRELLETGDQLLEVQGVLSGTLSFLFNSFTGDRKFSELVFEARDKGYTEPDPRDDLSGLDVARKLVILAREAGIRADLSAVNTQSLVESNHQGLLKDEFLRRLPECDDLWKERRKQAEKDQKVLRYVASIKCGSKPNDVAALSVSLQAVCAKTHPLARISGTDNMVLFRTKRYDAQPLVIQGPGAGRDVTAAGVFADLMKLSLFTGASSL